MSKPEEEGYSSARDYVDALREAGIDPQQFADLARKVLGVENDDADDKIPTFSDDNIPGYEYLQRVSAAAGRALAANVERMNGDWAEIRNGRYTVEMALQSWAAGLENCYSIVTEAARGPSQLPRPAWLVVPYSKKKPPAPALSVKIDGIFEQPTTLEYTKLEGLGHTVSTEDIYAEAPVGIGSRVEVRLNDAAIQNLKEDTDHVGFIFRKGMGAAPPHVIVVVRVLA